MWNGLSGLDCCFWTLSHIHTIKYSSQGLSLLLYCFFHLPLWGLQGSVSHLQYFRQWPMCLWGQAEKGTAVLGRQWGTCTAYEITQRNNGNQTPTGLPTLSPTSCIQDSASRKDVHPNSANVLQPQDYFYLFFFNSPRYALSATGVMFHVFFISVCT